MNRKDWNPELYLKFGKERIQPSIDLVSRISFDNPENILDIGCGPGNSTQVLNERWPNSKILGIDNSLAMIEKAKNDYPNQEWMLSDAGKDNIPGKYDIVFSNATFQWIPNHLKLLKKIRDILFKNGVIAVQIPLFLDMPLRQSIEKISQNIRWSEQTKGVSNLFTIHSYKEYYDFLADLFIKIDMWETHYMHIMDSQKAILEMIRSTGLKPYLERLETDKDKNEFEQMVLNEIKKEYPNQENGKVLFPFKRLFFIAEKE
jgi:trans-aconitate 2-methyltransferase